MKISSARHGLMAKRKATVQLIKAAPVALAAMALSATLAQAAEYTIQIGAYEKPTKSLTAQASHLGEVNTALNDMGMTILTIGRYDTARLARVDLDSIRASYDGAFVRKVPDSMSWGAGSEGFTDNSTSTASSSDTTYSSGSTATVYANGSNDLSSLTADERQNAVYLDGVLRMKQGDSFMSLEEYRRSYSN